jgi:O-antigen/teichoic acid export membrane protein
MSLKLHILANYLGQGWTALMQLAFIPFYIKYLGMEAYGLIGVFTMLFAALTLLDLGMTPTLNREVARYNADSDDSQSIWDLLKSLEIIVFALAIFISFVVWLVSGWFAQNWLQPETIPFSSVSAAVEIMGIYGALRLVENLYRGAILGLQDHIWLNSITATLATVRAVGAIPVLAWISPTIEAFFIWQATISLLTAIVLHRKVYTLLPQPPLPAKFSFDAISKIWTFAQGIIITATLSLLLTHGDKVILSRMLNLESFGIYSLAALVSNSLFVLIGPLAQVYYPRFSASVARKDEVGLVRDYHLASQFMTLTIAPMALLLMLNAKTIMYIWTQNIVLAGSTASIIVLLTLGTAFLGLMNIPYMLQLAYGRSFFAAKVNAVIVTIQIPTLVWVTSEFGAMGAACIWVAVTSSYIFIVVNIMHKTILPKEKWRWYLRDTALPAGSAALVGSLLSALNPVGASNIIGNLLWLAFCGVLMFCSALLVAPDVCRLLASNLAAWKATR